MLRQITLFSLATSLLLLLVISTGSFAAVERHHLQSDQKIAEIMARKLVLDFFEDEDHEEIELEHEGDDREIEGVISAVEPEDNLEIKLEDLQAQPGLARGTLIIENPFRFKGEMKRKDREEIEISGEADLIIKLGMVAEVQDFGDEVKIQPKIEEMELEVEELRDVSPTELSGDKELIEEVFESIEEDLREDINEWLEENSVSSNDIEQE